MFATRQDLLTRSNAQRLAQLAVPADMAMVPLDVMRTALTGGSTDTEPADVQVAVAAALATIDQALTDAHELIVSYGIATDTPATAVLTRMCCTLAIYFLQSSERLEKTDAMGYDGVVKLLMQHKNGTLDLTSNAGTTGAGSDATDNVLVMCSQPSRFGADDNDDDGNEDW
ncbi:phage protein Gp36 family protein [Limnohabitans sp.]|uniref:phage protein Gp36 family protein n=1 Tax=Limnohabitans sp. TaxID=1907725 RepID=UPI00286F393C|nr:phage protein Gp36 family protein [Limnohabitans sp.]